MKNEIEGFADVVLVRIGCVVLLLFLFSFFFLLLICAEEGWGLVLVTDGYCVGFFFMKLF